MPNNDTLKTVGGLAAIGTIFYFGYKYYSNREKEETIKAQTAIVKSDAINSSKDVNPLIDSVKKLIAQNPKLKTYSDTEYRNFASSLYEYFKNRNLTGLVSVFNKLKTNVDVMLVTIYYAIKVFKTDNAFGDFEIHTYNLSQSINNLTNNIFRQQLEKLFAQKKITYKLF